MKFSKSALFLILIGIYFVLKFYEKRNWENPHLLSYDAGAYYSYVTAAFIYNHLSLADFSVIPNEDFHHFWYTVKQANGNSIIKMTAGVALLELPFFFIGHTYAKLNGYFLNGYTAPYNVSICCCALFYFFIGLTFLRKTLLFFFSENVTTLTIGIISLCTNLYYYVLMEPGMSHTYSFFAISLFVYYTVKHKETNMSKYFVLALLMLGIVALIRPVNILVGVFLFLYGVNSLSELKRVLLYHFQNWRMVLISVLAFLLPISIQIVYWKFYSGSFFVDTYGKERFFFSNPHVFSFLFSFRKGWLLYTPIMLFACLGIVVMLFKKKKYPFSLATAFFVLLFIYMCSSWYSWWFAASYGQRPMIDIYAILALGMAVFIDGVFNSKRTTVIFIPAVLFFAKLNFIQMWQYEHTWLHYDSMTKEAYKILFFEETTLPPDFQKYLCTPNVDLALMGKEQIDCQVK